MAILCWAAKNSLRGTAHPPPQNRRNLAEPPVPRVAGVLEVAKMSPECCQNVTKGSHVTSGVRGDKSPISRQFFN